MVKTRHQGDMEDETLGEFLSDETRRSRRRKNYSNQENGYDSDESGIVTVGPHSRTREIHGEDSPEEETGQRERRTRRARPRYNMDDYDDTPGNGFSARYGTRRKTYGMARPSGVVNGDLSGSIRRSTRQRKLIYGTFNQTLIDHQLAMMREVGDEDSYQTTPEEEKHTRKRRRAEIDPLEQEDGLDMYTRVKRERKRVKRDMYGIPIHEEKESSDDSSDETSSSDSGDSSDDEEEGGDGPQEAEDQGEDDDDEEEQPTARSYFLREHKPRTNLYEAPPIEPKRPKNRSIFRESPPRSTRAYRRVFRSPVHRSPCIKKGRRRAAFHGSSSTSSSSSSESSDDERRFERRKSKSMAKARNRCLPMNLNADDVASGTLRDRVKIGSSLADVDPMNIDRTITFESVGGLGKHVRALKEMVVFPLLYPEVFERFKIAPPRGVLFYGPPGTGKTLVARALANECSTGERKVAFFMRKGADCLSKWVGESERQLRLLFDQAYQMRPSIIFFDEIDGLAPVRSSRQDQIHSSIVSTLLALMDGLDNRGEIVVIGATNRIDSIDPALRRPGRFDREFLFPLPSVEARKQILQIHTKAWNPTPCDPFLAELAEKCVGYCGADLKALCTEAALHALRRRYPQIYTSSEKLQLDVSSILVSAKDFHQGMQSIIPTSQRSVASPGRALLPAVKPLLEGALNKTLEILQQSFPSVLANLASVDTPTSKDPANGNDFEIYSDDDDDSPPIYENNGRGNKARRRLTDCDGIQRPFMSFNSYAYQRPQTHRPRMLLAGLEGQGQSTHLAPAVLHHLEKVPCHVLDLPAMFAVSAKTPEEACTQIFHEARRTSPSIIYIPHIFQWWDVIGDTLRATFRTLLNDLEPSAPLLLLATCEVPHQELPLQIRELFDTSSGEVMHMQNPTDLERKAYFEDLLINQAMKPPTSKKQADGKSGKSRRARRMLEVLPIAPPPEPRKLTETELRRLHQQEDATLRELRLFLRDVLNKLGRDRKFGIFAKPVDDEEVPDYYEIIKTPMDLSSMMSKIDLHKYSTVKEFLDDINLICCNALEYNPATDQQGRAIRHRACALKDTAAAIVNTELDPEFEKLCEEIAQAKEKRGESPAKTVPDFYFTRPLNRTMMGVLNGIPADYPSRFSRRVRGMDSEEATQPESERSDNPGKHTDNQEDNEVEIPKIRQIVRKVPIKGGMKKKGLSPWCRSSKRRYRRVIIYLDEHGREIKPPGESVEDQEENKEANESTQEADRQEDPKSGSFSMCQEIKDLVKPGPAATSPKGQSPQESENLSSNPSNPHKQTSSPGSLPSGASAAAVTPLSISTSTPLGTSAGHRSPRAMSTKEPSATSPRETRRRRTKSFTETDPEVEAMDTSNSPGKTDNISTQPELPAKQPEAPSGDDKENDTKKKKVPTATLR